MSNTNFPNFGAPSIEELKQRLENDSKEHGLVVSPLISKKQIESGSIDVRLGNEFIISKRTHFDSLDPSQGKQKVDSLIKQYQEKVYIETGEKLILHPQQFVLGATLEHVRLPYDLLAYVIGRSSWGRLGLIIATATVVNPGYSGSITLELTNVGDTPITLYPGTRVAQLVFHTVNPPYVDPGESKYDVSTGPVFSKIHEDKEWPAYEILKNDKESSNMDLIKNLLDKEKISKEEYEKIKNILESKES